MPNVYPNNGSFVPAKEIFVKDADTWKTVKEVWVNDAGTWKKAFPESTGTQTYTTPGTYSWTVPNGVYSLSVPLIVGAGGGGGGVYGPGGDIWGGGGGGSGGYLTSQTVSVTPGETLTIVVGSGGGGGYDYYNGFTGTGGNGGNGSATQIKRGSTVLVTAAGGNGGTNAPAGDNGSGTPGTGGSPNGVSGGYPRPNIRNDFLHALGGDNGTGYGKGGDGQATSIYEPRAHPTDGGNGYVSISW